jgi:hypothetical protein
MPHTILFVDSARFVPMASQCCLRIMREKWGIQFAADRTKFSR